MSQWSSGPNVTESEGASGGRVKLKLQCLSMARIFSNKPREGVGKEGESKMEEPKEHSPNLGACNLGTRTFHYFSLRNIHFLAA